MGRQTLSTSQLRDLIRYHILDTEWNVDNWNNEQLLPTSLSGASVRVNKYRDFTTGENVTYQLLRLPLAIRVKWHIH